MKRGAAILGTLVVIINAVVILSHDRAHQDLGVVLNLLQDLYAYIVIVGAPLVALILLWTPKIRLGGLILALSMAGSLAFATFFHYVHVSHDHVDHLPPGDAQGLFRLTAAAMIPAQILGILIGTLIWRRGGVSDQGPGEMS